MKTDNNGLLKCSESTKISIMQLKCEFKKVVKLNYKKSLILRQIAC